jgi:acetyl-CoA acetyltransferase
VNHRFSDQAAVVGIGYAPFSRDSGVSTLALAVEAVGNAIRDAGLEAADIDGYATYSVRGDSASPSLVSNALGNNIGMRYYLNQSGGGSLSHTVIGEAAMACILGVADYVVCYRALNGRSGYRMGATGRAPLASGEDQFLVSQGVSAPAARYAMAARAHMHKYGTTEKQLGAVAVNQRRNASMNSRALMRDPLNMEQYLAGRWIAEPLRVYDCCLETDGACAVVVTTAERARDLARRPILISNAVWGPGHHVSSGPWPDLTEGGCHHTAARLFEGAGLSPADVDVAEIYDCFSFTVLLQLEDYGFCPKGEAGPFVESGATTLSGNLPVNTHGGFLSEAYVHGLNTFCEAVSQLRGDAGERQVAGAEVALSTGADGMIAGHTSATLLRKG